MSSYGAAAFDRNVNDTGTEGGGDGGDGGDRGIGTNNGGGRRSGGDRDASSCVERRDDILSPEP